jgi:transcriptional regulator with XRE-family HTH domain
MAKQQSAKSLQQIRRGRALTQRALAERCRVGQSAIAKMERRADWYVSHLREYVAAMGGPLLGSRPANATSPERGLPLLYLRLCLCFPADAKGAPVENLGRRAFVRNSDLSATSKRRQENMPEEISKISPLDVDTEPERKIFARNFRQARREAKLSQRAVHRLTGIAQSHISEIETAQVNICLDTIVKLARLVRKPVWELFKP